MVLRVGSTECVLHCLVVADGGRGVAKSWF
jgi:hypothetical protein